MKEFVLVPIDHEANRPKLTARHVLLRFGRFVVGGAAVALLAAACGAVLTTAGLVLGGSIVGSFLAFGLLGHAWGRPPEQFWWSGALLGGAIGLVQGVARGGDVPILDVLLRANIGFIAHVALYASWAAIFLLCYRSAEHKNALAAVAGLGGWLLGDRVSARLVARLQTQSDVLQLAAGPLGAAAQAAVAGFLLACLIVFLCEEPPAPRPKN